MSYFGPTGNGVQGEPVGCKRFFEEIDFNTSKASVLLSCMENFAKTVGEKRDGDSEDSERNNAILEGLKTLIKSFCEAVTLPE